MSTDPSLLQADTEALADAIVRFVADSPCDPIGKPFAALGAAATICQIAAASGSEELCARLAMATLVIVRDLAPHLVVDVPPRSGGTMH
jgi:hypothetical protein